MNRPLILTVFCAGATLGLTMGRGYVDRVGGLLLLVAMVTLVWALAHEGAS